MLPRLQRYRKVIFIRMDAFYASVEQRDRPELRHRPILIGAPPQERGQVESASSESQENGVRPGMPMKTALRLCPEAVRLSPAPEKYRQVQLDLLALCHEYTDLVEDVTPEGIYLDVTYNEVDIPFGQRLAKLLKGDIRRRLHLTAILGLGPNKLLARIASTQACPDGLTVVHPNQATDFLAKLPVESLPPLSKGICRKLAGLEVRTIGQLANLDHRLLARHFGKQGTNLWEWSRGRDDVQVKPNSPPDQLVQEIHFPADQYDIQEIHYALNDLAASLKSRLQRRKLVGRMLTLTVRYPNHRTIGCSCPLAPGMNALTTMASHAHTLLQRTKVKDQGVRLLGLVVSGFETGPLEQLELFSMDQQGNR